MQPHELARQAVESTVQYEPVLSTEIRRKMAYGWVALWLAENQEASGAAETAVSAVACIGAML